MTALVALGPLAASPLIVWLLMEFGPERGVLFALYWIIPAIVFALAMPVLRRRGRSLAHASGLAVAWGIGITMIVFVGLLFGFAVRARAAIPDAMVVVAQAGARSPSRPDTTVRVPAVGSPTRTGVLDAVRAHAGVTSKFKVTFVRATDRWAFVRCVEVVANGTQLEETDLDIAALVERRTTRKGPQWKVAELWSLATNDEHPYTPFARRVRRRARDAHLPDALFPAGFLKSDVPVE